MKPKIIVHGGARSRCKDEARRLEDVKRAGEKGYEVLLQKTAVDAVEAAIAAMEASPYLNAGIGSFLQLDGRVRMDASIMKSDLSAGAVVNIEDVEHPISVARNVMENTQHIMLSGKLATEFAHSEGFAPYDPRTRKQVEVWLDIMDEFRKKTSYEQIFHVDQYLKQGKHSLGTVGCVAIDKNGHIASGTSTGGLRMNVPGRIGDSPIIGAGNYCSIYGGVSCTGEGEKIIVLALGKAVINYLRYHTNATAQQAVAYGLQELASINGKGGLICIDKNGTIGYGFNTETMTYYYLDC